MRVLAKAASACAGLRAAVDEAVEAELLELAAEQGDYRAGYLYSMTQYARIKTSGTTMEELGRFRANSQRYLQSALDAGQSRSLFHIGRAYERGEAYRHDGVAAAAYYGAYLELQGRNTLSYDRAMRSLSEAEQSRARALQREILAGFTCRDCPSNP